MSQFNIPLNPVAQPTNQFVAPRIEAPSNQDASDLAQLSGALAKITPELASVFQNRFQAHVEGSTARADADFQNRRYDNMKALKAAVDAGQIDEADNPWYMVQLEKDVAANQAEKKVQQMKVDWEESPVRFSDDPKEVDAWANQQLTEITDFRDADIARATLPVIQEGKSQLLNRHMEVRRQERAEERVVNFQQRVSTLLQGDPKTAAPELQRLISDARMTMSGTQVNELVLKAASTTAEATGDEGILSVLSSIPNHGAGGTLADSPEVKALQQQLPLMRLRRSMQIDQYLEHQQEQQTKQRKDAMLSNLMQASSNRPELIRITPEIASKWGVSFADTIDLNEKAIRYGDLQLEQNEKGFARLDKAKDRQARSIQSDIQLKLARGTVKVTDPEVLDSMARLAELSPDAANQFNRYLADRHDMDGWRDRVFARESDPNTYNELWSKAKTGSLVPADLIPQAEKLSHEDWTRLYHETIKPDTGGTKVSDFPMAKYDDLLKDMIVWPQADEKGGYDLAAKDPFVNGAVTRAQTRFAEVTQRFLNDPEFTKLPRDEQTVRLRKALDSTAQEFGGITDADRQRKVDEQKAKEEQTTKETQAKLHPEGTFKDGQGKTASGIKYGAPTALTDEQRSSVRNVAESLANADFSTRSIGQVYSDPLGFTSRGSFKNRPQLVLGAFIRNARLLKSGSINAEPSARVTDSLVEPKLIADSNADVRVSANLNFKLQRDELTQYRKSLEGQWITPERRDRLMSMTATLGGKLASGGSVSPEEVSKYRELSDAFRLYDFLCVTAGVNRDDIKEDYRVLYKYPAAASHEELKNLIPTIAKQVPAAELASVMETQRTLIDHAHDRLINGKYQP